MRERRPHLGRVLLRGDHTLGAGLLQEADHTLGAECAHGACPFPGGMRAWRHVLLQGPSPHTELGLLQRAVHLCVGGPFARTVQHGGVSFSGRTARMRACPVSLAANRTKKYSPARDSTLLDENSRFLLDSPADFNSHLNRHGSLMWERAALSPVAIARLICSYNERRCIC